MSALQMFMAMQLCLLPDHSGHLWGELSVACDIYADSFRLDHTSKDDDVVGRHVCKSPLCDVVFVVSATKM